MQINVFEDGEYVDFLKRDWAGHDEENSGHPAQIIRAIGSGWDQADVNLLDVGCGTGRLKRYFKKAMYFGVDMSAVMVDQCRSAGLDVRQAPIYKIPFVDQSFDLVVCNAVLFHIGFPLEAVNELWRVTKGRLAFSCYWEYSLYKPIHLGALPVLHEDKEAGLSRWVVANTIPAWQIKRHVGRLEGAKRVKSVWLDRGIMPRLHRVAIMVVDR